MIKKIYIGSLLLILLSYGIYQLYWYNQEECNLVLYVTNESSNDPFVNIEVYIDDKLVVNDIFYPFFASFDKRYCLSSNFGIKRIKVKVDDKIQYNGHFILFGIRWIHITNHSDENYIYLSFNFLRRCCWL